jgi:gamma-glutamylcysteine synthetase
MSDLKKYAPTIVHKAFKDDLTALLNKYAGELRADEALAIASQIVGMLVAYQDKNTMTPFKAGEIIQANLEVGNRIAVTDIQEKERLLREAKPMGNG